MSDEMATHAGIGNALHAAQLSVVIAYAIAVIGHSSGWWTLSSFGLNWLNDGFCLSFKDSLFHSHLLCLYMDTACAFGLFVLSRHAASRPELALVKENAISVFFHGLVHGLLWLKGPLRERDDAQDHSVLSFVITYLFFFSFVCLMTPSPYWFGALQSVAHTLILARIPWILSFTYVNTVIGFNLSIWQMLTSPRDIYYVLYPLLFAGPVLLTTLAEPLLCDRLLVFWGGHVFFDMSIPFGAVLYFIVASTYPPRKIDKSD